MARWLGLGVLRLLAIVLLAGLLGAALLRLAPGFATDERQLDAGLSARSMEAIRRDRLADSNIPHYYARYLLALAHGDLGVSRSLNQPVRTLLRERLPVTLRTLSLTLAVAWIAGLALAVAAQLSGSRLVVFAADGLSGALLSTPAAVLALIFVLLRWPPAWAAAWLVLPKVYRYALNFLRQSYALPHVLAARAKGAGAWRVLAWHAAPSAAPQLLALVGVSFSLALGALLPIEVVCDVHGIGQLAWQAAEARDLPLLAGLTPMVTLLTVCATMLSDVARRRFMRDLA